MKIPVIFISIRNNLAERQLEEWIQVAKQTYSVYFISLLYVDF
jgi:hypothetical protein